MWSNGEKTLKTPKENDSSLRGSPARKTAACLLEMTALRGHWVIFRQKSVHQTPLSHKTVSQKKEGKVFFQVGKNQSNC